MEKQLFKITFDPIYIFSTKKKKRLKKKRKKK